MPKAHEVATELRRIADALDRDPEAGVQKPYVSFYCYEKEMFLRTARILPRPLGKKYDNYGNKSDRLRLVYNGPALDLDCNAPRSLISELVEPAKPAVYNCEPILSPEEEESLV